MTITEHGDRRLVRVGLLGVGVLLLAASAACTRGAPLQGSQQVLLGTWTSASGARLVIREDGSCDYHAATDKVDGGTLLVLSSGHGGTLRCRTVFGGGVSLNVDRWPVNDFRGRTPRTFMILGGVDYLRKGGPSAP